MKGVFKIFIIIASALTFLYLTKSILKINSSVAPDFHVLWVTASDLPTDRNPYQNPEKFTGLGYPANTLLFYLPFIKLDYMIAQNIFTFVSLASIAISTILVINIAFKKNNKYIFLTALVLIFNSFPTKFTLGMGQNNAISLLLLVVSFYYYLKKSKTPAGILLGLAISLKTIFVFFLLFFFLRKQFSTIKYALIVIAVSVILTILVSKLGPEIYRYYFAEVLPPLFSLEGGEIYYNQGILSFVSRLTEPVAIRSIGTKVASIILALYVSWLTFVSKNDKLTFSLFIITLLLIDKLSWQHHLVWLIVPFIFLTAQAIKTVPKHTLALPLAYLLISWNFDNPQSLSAFPQNLLLSHAFFGLVLLFIINAKLLRSYKPNSSEIP